MPAWEDQETAAKTEGFRESCCDGGAAAANQNSAQPCGCDPGCKPEPHQCDSHRAGLFPSKMPESRGAFVLAIEKKYAQVRSRAIVAEQRQLLEEGRGVLGSQWTALKTIKDSGERITFASGSMRDPSTGKIKWSRITYGPMMRRWAQHLTTAEAKYPDAAPGVPNFTLIETEEEFFRYKESAFRHFMAWYHDEVDEDHASACYFNINGVEIIKDKQLAVLGNLGLPKCHNNHFGFSCSFDKDHVGNHRAYKRKRAEGFHIDDLLSEWKKGGA